MSVSLQSLHDVLDELRIVHNIDKKNNRIKFLVIADDPCEHSIKMTFTVGNEGDIISATGVLCEYDLDDSDNFKAAYRFCNKWNCEMLMPKAEVIEEQKMLLCEWFWDTGYEITEELLRTLIVFHFLAPTDDCIKAAIKEGLYPDLSPRINLEKD